MIRRQFLEQVAKVGAAGLVSLPATGVRTGRAVAFAVSGFSCLTCATGLETMLSRERGILSVATTYPQGQLHVTYDADVTDAEKIAAAVRGLGFGVSAAS